MHEEDAKEIKKMIIIGGDRPIGQAALTAMAAEGFKVMSPEEADAWAEEQARLAKANRSVGQNLNEADLHKSDIDRLHNRLLSDPHKSDFDGDQLNSLTDANLVMGLGPGSYKGARIMIDSFPFDDIGARGLGFEKVVVQSQDMHFGIKMADMERGLGVGDAETRFLVPTNMGFERPEKQTVNIGSNVGKTKPVVLTPRRMQAQVIASIPNIVREVAKQDKERAEHLKEWSMGHPEARDSVIDRMEYALYQASKNRKKLYKAFSKLDFGAIMTVDVDIPEGWLPTTNKGGGITSGANVIRWIEKIWQRRDMGSLRAMAAEEKVNFIDMYRNETWTYVEFDKLLARVLARLILRVPYHVDFDHTDEALKDKIIDAAQEQVMQVLFRYR